jgi:hypothetical protein
MDYTKINEQIEAIKKVQVQAELDLIAESTARLEKARLDSEKRRIAAEEAVEKQIDAIRKKRKDAADAAAEIQRAEQAKVRAEEHKQNLAMEAKKREEQGAAALQQKLLELQHNHERALRALKDSFDMAANSGELVLIGTDGPQVLDGSVLKPVVDNIDGAINPLDRFRQNDNK